MKSVFFYDFDGIKTGIVGEDTAIIGVFFANEDSPQRFTGCEIAASPVIIRAASQLAGYFEGKRRIFDIPLALHGTPFQKSVWNALLSIPYGETRSYKDIAVMTGNPQAARAVGMANNRNPIAIIVPCHRVIGSNGSLTGYAGGLSLKKRLLDIEHAKL